MAFGRTANPALSARAFRGLDTVGDRAMSVQGTVNKTGLLLIIAMATAGWTWERFDGKVKRLRKVLQAAPFLCGQVRQTIVVMRTRTLKLMTHA